MRHPGSLRSIQALGRHLALPLALVDVALVTLLAFGHRCSGQWSANTMFGDWPERPAVELNVPPYRHFDPGFSLLSIGHTDSGAAHQCALCALHHQESAPPARAPQVRLSGSRSPQLRTIAPSPLTGAPLTATSRGPPPV